MSHRRLLGGGVFVLIVILAIAAVFYQIGQTPKQLVNAWVVVPTSIPAGTVLQASDVQRIQVPADLQTYVSTQDPVGDTTAHVLRAGDQIRTDDLINGAMSEVNLKFQSPPLVVGDIVDIYAEVTSLTPTQTQAATGATPAPIGESVELIGPHLTVVAVTGDGAAVVVSTRNEPLWLSLEASGQIMFASIVNSSSARVPLGTDPQTALQDLSGITPAAAPTPTPTASATATS
jgi:hypothetical protein